MVSLKQVLPANVWHVLLAMEIAGSFAGTRAMCQTQADIGFTEIDHYFFIWSVVGISWVVVLLSQKLFQCALG